LHEAGIGQLYTSLSVTGIMSLVVILNIHPTKPGGIWVQTTCMLIVRCSRESQLIDNIEDEITKSGLGICESTTATATRHKTQNAPTLAPLSKQNHASTKNATVLCIDFCSKLWGMVSYKKCLLLIKPWTLFFRRKNFRYWICLILTISHFAVPFETPRPETLYNTCIDGWNSNCGPHTPSVLQTHFSYVKFTNRILTLVITYTLYDCPHFCV
jgi:hypothetical protein